MTTVAIHQPGYFPWLGFFKKMIDSDIFVFLDDVQYEKNGWQNRNKIRTSDGSIWLTVPVRSNLSSNLNEIKIDSTLNWVEKHKKSISINYSKSRYYKEFSKSIESLYGNHFDLLININMKTIELIMGELQIKTKTIFSSELDIKEKGTDRIIAICKTLGADVYLSGVGLPNKKYLNVEDFPKNNIILRIQNFQHPIYNQCYQPFLPNMSAIDLLLNEGKNSRKILLDSIAI